MQTTYKALWRMRAGAGNERVLAKLVSFVFMKWMLSLLSASLLFVSACTDDQKSLQKRLENSSWNIEQYYEEYGAVKLEYKQAGHMEFNSDLSGKRTLIVNGDTTINTFSWNLGVESISLLQDTESKTFKVLTDEDNRQVWEYNKDGDIIRYTLTK